MGWFDEQIKQRKKNDDDIFAESCAQIAKAAEGRKITDSLKGRGKAARDAVEEILRYYHIKKREIPETIEDLNEQLEYVMRPWGIMRRTVALEKGWYQDAFGPMLGIKKENGEAVALIPSGWYGYRYLDSTTGTWRRVNKKKQELFEKEAMIFYRPFPLKKRGIPALLSYISQTLSAADFIMAGMAMLAGTLVSMLLPVLSKLLFSEVMDSGNVRILASIAVFMICVAASKIIAESIKALIMARIDTKLSVSVEAATMMKVLSLPVSFFKEYSAGELASRVQNVEVLCKTLVSTVVSTVLAAAFSLLYMVQIFHYAPPLANPALLVLLATLLVSVITSRMQIKVSRRQMEHDSKENGMTYGMISGIQKIKLTGSEKRAFARWAEFFADGVKLTYNPPLLLKINTVLFAAVSLTGTFAIYFVAVKSHISVSDYYAFYTAYAMASGAFLSLQNISLIAADIKPQLEMIKPILDGEPEISEGKKMVSRLSGGLELNNVSFRYKENMPLVLDNLSLKIHPGQYVAIVGKTGCGKSTLLRLLMGFEKPLKGAIYYDGMDINSLDLKSLRKNMGVVMQNSKLFQGDVFSNISISAPFITLDEAWEAAEMAGIAEDIRRMPMGMQTVISEGGGNISGGQRQRLMIARAIASKPKILMFDEATSALDNITQKKVSESLDRLKCTRIVIAHRLSTIRNCDRIIVLDKGKIIEDGAYEELIEKKGFFAELVERQRI